MDIRFLYTLDKGNLKDERVVLQSNEDINIGRFLIFATQFKNDSVPNNIKHTYWLPDIDVKKGDKVIIYTKSGQAKWKENKEGRKSHFLYWELSETIWDKENMCCIILEADKAKLSKIE